MIISIPDVWGAAVNRHHAYVKKVIQEALAVSNPKPIGSPFLVTLLKTEAKTLAVGKPDELEGLIDKVDQWLASASATEQRVFRAEAKRVFNYGAFSKKSQSSWDAYALCKSSRHSLCPYCQQAFAFTLVVQNKVKTGGVSRRGFRPTLDHYFPKSEYPYLGLSLYNLVPACQTCNSSLKSTTNFYKEKHLHPLRDEECLRFELKPKGYIRYLQRSTAGLGLKVVNDDAKMSSQANASIETFLLNKRYAFHARELARLIESLKRWTPDVIAQLAISSGATESFDQFEAMLLNFDHLAYKSEMLGRIKLDLYNAVRATP